MFFDLFRCEWLANVSQKEARLHGKTFDSHHSRRGL